MARGGKRDGAGRKATGSNPKRVSLHLSVQPEQAEQIKKMATDSKKTVSRFILDKILNNS